MATAFIVAGMLTFSSGLVAIIMSIPIRSVDEQTGAQAMPNTWKFRMLSGFVVLLGLLVWYIGGTVVP